MPLPIDYQAALRSAMRRRVLAEALRGLDAAADDKIQQALAHIEKTHARNLITVVPEVDQIITVNEAGVAEVMCIKCKSRELTDVTGQVPGYSHQFMNPDHVLEWDVGKAWQLVRASGRKPMLASEDLLYRQIEQHSNLTPHHLEHIPAEALAEPILMDVIYMPANGLNREVVPCAFLIDGHHRAARNLLEAKPTCVFVLMRDEQKQVLSDHPGKYDAELTGWRTRTEAAALDIQPAPIVGRMFTPFG